MAAGKMLGQAAQQVDAVYEKEATELARAKTSEGMTAYEDWSRQQRMAATKVQGKDAEGIGGRFATEAQAKAAEIRATLSPRAQQAFDLQVRARMGSDQNYFAAHETQQKQVYMDSQSAARIGSLNEEMSLAWDSPEARRGHMLAIRSEVAAIGQRKGWDADTLAYQTQKAENDALKGVILRAVKEDPIKARQLFEENRGVFDSQTAYTLDGATKESAEKEVVARDGAAAWEQAGRPVFMDGGPSASYAPGDYGAQAAALMPTIYGIESGGRDLNPDGSIVTSPKGAQGKAQVMPATQADPGFGVRPAQDDSLAEKDRVGRDYFAAMLKRYDGNEVLAAAAYNAGPGKVDEWLKANGDPREVADLQQWVDKIPFGETRDYVRKMMARAGEQGITLQAVGGASGGGQPQPPGPPLSPEAQYLRVVRANQQRYERGEISADMLTKLNTDAKARATAEATARKAQVEALQDDAYRHIATGGKLDDWFKANPQAYGLLGDKLKSLEEYAANKDEIVTDFATYNELVRLSDDDKRGFSEINLNDYRTQLSLTDLQKLAKRQSDIRQGRDVPPLQTARTAAADLFKAYGWNEKAGKESSVSHRIETVMERAEALVTEAQAAGITLTTREIKQKLAPLFFEFDRGLGADLARKNGSVSGWTDYEIDVSKETIPDIATMTGMTPEEVKRGVAVIEGGNSFWPWSDNAPLSARNIFVAATGAPESFVDEYLKVAEEKGMTPSATEIGVAYREREKAVTATIPSVPNGAEQVAKEQGVR
jgi:hypothetical protein